MRMGISASQDYEYKLIIIKNYNIINTQKRYKVFFQKKYRKSVIRLLDEVLKSIAKSTQELNCESVLTEDSRNERRVYVSFEKILRLVTYSLIERTPSI